MGELDKKNEVALAKKAIEEAGLYLVGRKDMDRLTDITADAYQEYPLHNWFMNGRYDKAVSKLMMGLALKTMVDNGVFYADSKEMNGFAVWMPPGYTGSKVIPCMVNGGVKLALTSGLGIVSRMVSYETYAMKLKKQLTNHRDWYFYNLSVKKDAQGKGIGSKLVKPMLRFCDEQKRMAYLETNKKGNVEIYKHFGFDLMKEEFVPKSTVSHYAMLRQPKQL